VSPVSVGSNLTSGFYGWTVFKENNSEDTPREVFTHAHAYVHIHIIFVAFKEELMLIPAEDPTK